MAEAQNPYRAPSADLNVGGSEVVGGNIEQTLAGRGRLDLGEVMNDAWGRTKGAKRILLGGLLLFYVALTALLLGLALLFAPSADEIARAGLGVSFGTQLLVQLVVIALVFPFLAGVNLTAARHAAGRPIAFGDLFAQYGKFLPLLGAGILIQLLTMIGFVLLIVPGIYLSVAYVLTPVLIVDRDMGVWQAMETSRKLVTKHWLTVFFLLFVGGMVVGLSGFLLLIPLIWTFPWFVLCIGVVYRNLAGVRTP